MKIQLLPFRFINATVLKNKLMIKLRMHYKLL